MDLFVASVPHLYLSGLIAKGDSITCDSYTMSQNTVTVVDESVYHENESPLYTYHVCATRYFS